MIWFIVLCCFLASILTFYSGFGLGTVLMPVFAVFFPLEVAIALTAVIHLLNNLLKVGLLFSKINWKIVLWFGLPALGFAWFGSMALVHVSTLPTLICYSLFNAEFCITYTKLIIGFLLILFALVEWFTLQEKYTLSMKYLPLGGIVSGFFGGLSGHQGALRSVFLLHAGLDTKTFIGTSAAISVFVDFTRVITYSVYFSHLFTAIGNMNFVIITAAGFLGTLTATLWLHKITLAFIQKLVAIFLILIGFLLMAGII